MVKEEFVYVVWSGESKILGIYKSAAAARLAFDSHPFSAQIECFKLG